MRLGMVLKSWRKQHKLGVREAADLIGISAATLNRIERTEECSGRILAKLLRWLLED
jgi:transcriptional regulator with XRE-family HTH domain